jgi:hypothetical protein
VGSRWINQSLALPSSNQDQDLGGGCNLEIADMRIYHNFSDGFKSTDMLEKSKV